MVADSDRSTRMTWEMRLRIAIDAAQGWCFLVLNPKYEHLLKLGTAFLHQHSVHVIFQFPTKDS